MNVMNVALTSVLLRTRMSTWQNGRCRMHGGASTGPRTAEGLARLRRARWKHGLYSAEALDQQLTRMLLLRKQMQAG